MEAERAKKKKPVPNPDAGMDRYDIIGKKVQGNCKFHLWEKANGEMYGRDQCTWQACRDQFDGAVLCGQAAQFKIAQTVYKAKIENKHDTHDGEDCLGCGMNQESTFAVTFSSKRHPHGQRCWVDLELPRKVGDGEYSYWKFRGSILIN